MVFESSSKAGGLHLTEAAELIIGVPDCRGAHAVLTGRGAQFLAPPVEYPREVRAFFRDPDGHLFEISQRRAPS